jgi:carboxypeptidase Q
MVPVWVRGEESADLIEPVRRELTMLGLGMSVGTPPEGITAEVHVVESFEALEKDPGPAKGRIVLFDAPYTKYGETVRYRSRGASAAAKHGAVACLIRSVGPRSLNTPHTGMMSYEDGVPRIPAAALTLEDSAMLGRMAKRGERIVVRLAMEAHMAPDAPSANVVAEIVGREKPEEIVLVGGHFDCWDSGPGVMDDGGGCVMSWEAVRLMKALDLRPRRTVRCVLFTNEENGLAGAKAYHEAHSAEADRHVLAIETDSGTYRPTGFGFTGSPEARAIVVELAARHLAAIGASEITEDGGGADIGPMMREGVPGMGLRVDGPYFDVHHTAADTFDKVAPDDLRRCVAAMAVMAYAVADLESPLPRAEPDAARATKQARISVGSSRQSNQRILVHGEQSGFESAQQTEEGNVGGTSRDDVVGRHRSAEPEALRDVALRRAEPL